MSASGSPKKRRLDHLFLIPPLPDQVTGSRSSRPDGFSQDPGYLASQEKLRGIIFSLAHSAAPTRGTSPEGDGSGDVDQISHRIFPESPLRLDREGQRLHPSLQPCLSDRRRVDFLKNYVTQVAPGVRSRHVRLSMHLSSGTACLGTVVSGLVLCNPRNLRPPMEHKNNIQGSFDSLELYQEAIRLLSPRLQERDPKIVAACVLLCCLEMMSARAQDWRRHLEGCAAVFEAFDISGLGKGSPQDLFWCYARMDLCGALISDGTQATLLHPSKWIPQGCCEEDAHGLFLESKSPDMNSNYALYLCAKVTELISDRTMFVELGESNGCTMEIFSSRWLQHWNDLQNWLSERPKELLPVETINDKPFLRILFVHFAAIPSNQLYHTAAILLLKMIPKGIKLPRSPYTSPLWHARRICGISLTNPHQGCLNYALQPLWIAGRLFSHPSEHKQITELIRDIEIETGWECHGGFATWKLHGY
ncbi:hypothetical protein CNMCM8980_001522 [Aspergillus fumigatiaffinis]|nr:hypothetical protein CNMCM5878_003368 [Aspergillus fumigatiaffinis]KAF4221321.1 hypothetical protein CNMCM6457_001894 [Aspergillus fumigatiaffinis]KAF4239813.1 hypothetical protein CNMCM8980_001522 [Aspergillus fumigatiaffinis]